MISKSDLKQGQKVIANLAFFQNLKKSFSPQFLHCFKHFDNPQKASFLDLSGGQKSMKKRTLKNALTKSRKNTTWNDIVSKSVPKWCQDEPQNRSKINEKSMLGGHGDPKAAQDHHRRSQDPPKTENRPHIDPKSAQNPPNIDPISTPNMMPSTSTPQPLPFSHELPPGLEVRGRRHGRSLKIITCPNRQGVLRGPTKHLK